MRIWYLENGIDKICGQPVVVIAEGICGYFIESAPRILKLVPYDLVTAKLYNDSNDIPPSILEYLPKHEDTIEDIDYSLSDMFKTIQ